eukprot:2514188-Pleurochrysis_carterae.AAC.1
MAWTEKSRPLSFNVPSSMQEPRRQCPALWPSSVMRIQSPLADGLDRNASNRGSGAGCASLVPGTTVA